MTGNDRTGTRMTDPYADRRDQIFPHLTPAQIGRISGVGERRRGEDSARVQLIHRALRAL